jgi:hypothetical protein
MTPEESERFVEDRPMLLSGHQHCLQRRAKDCFVIDTNRTHRV